jgi:hypothetical protein
MPGDQNAHPAIVSPDRIHAEGPQGSLPEHPLLPLVARPVSFREPAQLAEAPPASLPGQVAVYHSST